MTTQATEHSSAAQRRIIREYLSFTCNHLPARKCFKRHVHDVWNIVRCGYASFNSFYNTVRPLFNRNRLKHNDTPPEFEQEILRDTAEIVCALNPGMKMRRAVKMVWNEYRHGYKNFESFYNSYLERRNHK